MVGFLFLLSFTYEIHGSERHGRGGTNSDEPHTHNCSLVVVSPNWRESYCYCYWRNRT